MSILKSILHRWNSTNKEYDTLHPETESSQITDWHTGIMNSLASTTLGTVVSALTTDSVAGKLLKLLLDASGVKYSLGTNGYVCLGSFFGGLIIQWGKSSTSPTTNGVTDSNFIYFPLPFSNIPCVIATENDLGLENYRFSSAGITNNGFKYVQLSSANKECIFMAVGH